MQDIEKIEFEKKLDNLKNSNFINIGKGDTAVANAKNIKASGSNIEGKIKIVKYFISLFLHRIMAILINVEVFYT